MRDASPLIKAANFMRGTKKKKKKKKKKKSYGLQKMLE